MKSPSILIASILAAGLGSTMAADITLGTATPPVGDGVQNLNFSTSAADQTAHAFVDSDYIGSTSALWVGQAFTSGANAAGYDLNSISVRQVSWGPTSWDFDGGSVSLRLFEITGTDGALYFTNEIGTAQTVNVPDATTATVGGTPTTPEWLTFTLDSPVSLNANSQYAFAFLSTGLEDGSNNEFLMEVDGTNTDVYAGGTSISVDGTTTLWRGGSGNDRAFVANMTAVPDPDIPQFSVQPADYFGTVGDTVELISLASGDPAPTYQWEFLPLSGGSWMNVPGATGSTLTLDPATYDQNGDYRVTATNINGSTTSNEVIVDVVYPLPDITQQPADAVVAEGGEATIGVVANSPAGGNLTYQWYKVDEIGGDIALSDGGNISGSSTADLSINPVGAADEGEYYVVVTDDAGFEDEGFNTEATSETASLALPRGTVTLGTAVPAVGDGVQNLNFSTSAADQTAHSFVDSDYISANVNGIGLWVGQAFTTGANAGGYDLNSISVRQVSWGPTNWDFDGGNVSIRLFEVTGTDGAVYFTNEVGTVQSVIVAGTTDATVGGTPTAPEWLTFTLDSPVSLNANSQYAFAFRSTGLEDGSNNEFLMEVDGTNTDVYAGGTSITVDGTTTLWRGGSGSDRAFVANMTALGGGGYGDWAAINVGGQTADQDFNGDGVQNGIAYFMNDTGVITLPGIDGTNTVTWVNGGNIAETEYGTQFKVQTSSDLEIWTDVLSGDGNLSNTADSLAYTLPTGSGELFARLVVIPN